MRLSFCSANLRNTSPRCRLSSSYSVFSAALRDEHHMVFALPLRYGLGFPSRPSRTPFRVLWRLTLGSLREGLLDLSNSYCLPGRAGGSPFVLVVDRVANDRAGHAMATAATATQFGADDGDDLDAFLAQQSVGVHVTVVGVDHARRRAHQVGAAVPLG